MNATLDPLDWEKIDRTAHRGMKKEKNATATTRRNLIESEKSMSIPTGSLH